MAWFTDMLIEVVFNLCIHIAETTTETNYPSPNCRIYCLNHVKIQEVLISINGCKSLCIEKFKDALMLFDETVSVLLLNMNISPGLFYNMAIIPELICNLTISPSFFIDHLPMVAL